MSIFKADPDGQVLWHGAAENFIAAKARIEKLERSSPREYLILDQMTGRKVSVTMEIPTPQAQWRTR
jgi:hypothetical protein